MSTYLEFSSGSASVDDAHPPQEDNTGFLFQADGVEHSCGWSKFVPASLRNPSSLILRFSFIDEGVGVGVVQYDLEWFNSSDSGPILSSGTHTLLVTVPNIAATIVQANIDISSWMHASATIFYLTMRRDSSNLQDTYAHSQAFVLARTV